MFSKLVVVWFFVVFLASTAGALAQEPASPPAPTSGSTSPPQSTPPPQTSPSPSGEPAGAAYTRKRELVDELETHANWYRADSEFYGRVFLTLTLLVLIGSVVTSLLVAIDFSQWGWAAKAVVVGLPLLTGLFTTVLGQFHIQELWKLRELGRIDALALRERVRALPTAATDVQMRSALLPYEQEKYELERRQALAFFEYLATKEEAEKAKVAGSSK